MITFTEVFRLENPFISAASGLVLKDETFYCVSDDDLHLSWFSRSLTPPIQTLPLFEGSLDSEPKLRKKQKPDIETLVEIPGQGSLLCIPSGSKKNRIRGALVSNSHQVQELKFEKTFSRLSEQIPELNIEGAVVRGEMLRLFQRGNGKLGQNAIIDLSLKDFVSDRVEQFQLNWIELGLLNGSPLGFTDACLVQDQIWFLGVAEKSDSTYDDGAFLGAILGTMNFRGEILRKIEIEIPFKPEGIVIEGSDVFLVTDADDRALPSRLFRSRLLNL